MIRILGCLILSACFGVGDRDDIGIGLPGEPVFPSCLQVSPNRLDLYDRGDNATIALTASPECGPVPMDRIELDDPESAFLINGGSPEVVEIDPIFLPIELVADEAGVYEAQLYLVPVEGFPRVTVQIVGEIPSEDTD